MQVHADQLQAASQQTTSGPAQAQAAAQAQSFQAKAHSLERAAQAQSLQAQAVAHAQAYAEAHAQAAHLAAKARKHAAAHAQAAAHASHLQKVAALGAPSVHVQHSRTRVGVQGFGQPHASSGMHTCACHETPSCIMERSTNMLRVWGARVPSAYLANYSRCGMQRMAQRRQ